MTTKNNLLMKNIFETHKEKFENQNDNPNSLNIYRALCFHYIIDLNLPINGYKSSQNIIRQI